MPLLPANCKLTVSVVHHHTGAFVTRVVQGLADGTRLVSESRRYRKRLPPIRFDQSGNRSQTSAAINPWSQLWAPTRLAWWIAILFIVGSTSFAVSSAATIWPSYFPPTLTSVRAINSIYFIGSLFFTTAAWIQLLEAINGDVTERDPSRSWRWVAWKPRNAGYMASLIQFVGTLLFNINTADGMIAGLNWVEQDILIWAPDIMGSACFLVASYLAMIEVSHAYWSFNPRHPSWWIAIINLLGCVSFLLSALLSVYIPQSGGNEFAWMSGFMTFIGACFFFAGSYLMIPELFGAGVTPRQIKPLR